VALYGRGAYAEALARFEAAYAVFPSAKIFLNQGQALLRLGRDAEAAEAFDRFLHETSPADGPAEGRRAAAASLAGLERRLGRVTLAVTPRHAVISIDAVAPRLRPGRPLYLSPGRHVIDASALGHVAARLELEIAAGERREVPLRLEPARYPASAPTPTPTPIGRETPVPPPPRPRLWTWVVAGAGAACLGGGIVFGLRASNAYDEYQTTDSPARYDQLAERIERDSLIANVLFGGAALAAVGAGVLFFLEPRGVGVAGRF
jgi:hypothetical protein